MTDKERALLLKMAEYQASELCEEGLLSMSNELRAGADSVRADAKARARIAAGHE